jgi:hypothetical protein
VSIFIKPQQFSVRFTSKHSVKSDIRRALELTEASTSFTRESSFYEEHKPVLGKFVAASYILMLGALLVAFLGFRIYSDFVSGNIGVTVVDILLAIPTIIFFIGYARSS